MLIATFNCNSVRVRLPLILEWLKEHEPDALCLQETKCPDEKFPAGDFESAGWCVRFRGEKKYNGVAVLTREEPDEVAFGLGDDEGQSETRLVRARLGDVHVLGAYVPQGREMDSEHFGLKLDWLRRLRDLLDGSFDHDDSRVVLVGDMNIAPEPKDVYDSRAIRPHVCHCDEVTEAYEDLVLWGLADVFRKHLPGEGVFTYWDYRMPRALERNRGWRLDHVLATRPMAEASTEVFVDLGPRKAEKPSDHTFVGARFDL